MSHSPQYNHWHEPCQIDPPLTGTWIEDLREDPTSISPPHWGHPYPISTNSEGGPEGGPNTHQPDAHPPLQSPCMQTGQPLLSTHPRPSATPTKSINPTTPEAKQLSNAKCTRSQTTNNIPPDTQATMETQTKHPPKHHANKRHDNNTVHYSPFLLIDNNAVHCSSNFVGVII